MSEALETLAKLTPAFMPICAKRKQGIIVSKESINFFIFVVLVFKILSAIIYF
jgi:hypothetical protein